ncbi:MAG: hypothetical protein ACOZNI_17570, partial [Myxococcota bacterium]
MLLAALVAALLFVATGPWGPGLTQDSATYLSTATHLSEGAGFVRFDGRAYVLWPPLYPVLISLGVHAGLSAARAAVVVNGLALWAAAVAVARVVRRDARAPIAALLAGLAVVLVPGQVTVAGSVWSETTFAAFVALAFVAVGRGGGLAVGVFVGLAALTRHVGIALAV